MNNLILSVILGLSVALVGSGAGNLYQWQDGKRAAAECEAARLKKEAEIATGTAKVEKDRADKVTQIGAQAEVEHAERLRKLDAAIARIGKAAGKYADATKDALPLDCVASGKRVDAVNEQRGYQ